MVLGTWLWGGVKTLQTYRQNKEKMKTDDPLIAGTLDCRVGAVQLWDKHITPDTSHYSRAWTISHLFTMKTKCVGLENRYKLRYTLDNWFGCLFCSSPQYQYPLICTAWSLLQRSLLRYVLLDHFFKDLFSDPFFSSIIMGYVPLELFLISIFFNINWLQGPGKYPNTLAQLCFILV